MRSKLVQEIKSITCEKRVRPAYMVTSPRSKNKNRVRDYHRNRKSTSRCHQKKLARNPYAASLSCKIALNEPDSSAAVLKQNPQSAVRLGDPSTKCWAKCWRRYRRANLNDSEGMDGVAFGRRSKMGFAGNAVRHIDAHRKHILDAVNDANIPKHVHAHL